MPALVPPVADERDGLLSYLAHERRVLRLAAYGLTDEQARATPSASELSVGGLIKHCANVERTWVDTVLQQRKPRSTEDYLAAFRLGPDESLAGVLDDYERAAAETDTAIAAIPDLDLAVPVPPGSPWLPTDIDGWSVRWVLLHVISETARHAGHADIVRESIDGATSFALMAADEQWPPSPWVQPWKAPTHPG
jgi:hypothetical protein